MASEFFTDDWPQDQFPLTRQSCRARLDFFCVRLQVPLKIKRMISYCHSLTTRSDNLASTAEPYPKEGLRHLVVTIETQPAGTPHCPSAELYAIERLAIIERPQRA